MTKPTSSAADSGLPTPRRTFLRSSAAAALAASPIAAAIAGPAVAASPLHGLIDAHREAYRTFIEAIDHENELEEAYNAAFPQTTGVPSLLGGEYGMRNGYDSCKKHIAAGYQHQREDLTPLSRIAPELAEQVRAMLNTKEVENMALVDHVFGEEQARQESFGLAAATRAKDEADDTESKALIALCAYPCKTLEEARIKAEYIVSTSNFEDGLQPEHAEALVQSFLKPRAAAEIEHLAQEG